MKMIGFQVWSTHTFFAFTFILIYLCFHIYKKYGIGFALTAFYFLFSAIMVAYSPINFYGKFIHQITPTVKNALITGLFSLGLVFTLTKKGLSNLLLILKVIAVANTYILFFAPCGIFNARSIDLTYTAMVMPLFFNEKNLWIKYFVLGLFGFSFVYFAHSTPIIMTMIILIVTYLMKSEKQYRWVMWSWLLAVAAGIAIAGGDFFTIANRYEVWKTVAGRYLKELGYMTFFGSGTGTYRWIGPVYQTNGKVFSGEYITDILGFAHNEYFQTWCEQGFLGLFILLFLMIYALWKTRKNYIMASIIVGTAASFWVQFPLRVETGFIFCLVMLRISMEYVHSELDDRLIKD